MNDQPTPQHGAGQQPAPSQRPLGGGQAGMASEAGARVQAIIEAAEKTAAAIVADAEAQAQRKLAESRLQADRAAAQRAQEISALTGDLIDRTEAVRRQSDELLGLLEEAKQRIGAAQAQPEPRPAPAQYEAETLVEGFAPTEPEAPPASDADGPAGRLGQHLRAVESQPNQAGAEDSPADSARLLTTQMAVAGSSRAEIESRLRTDFGIQDPAPLLDAILGQEE